MLQMETAHVDEDRQCITMSIELPTQMCLQSFAKSRSRKKISDVGWNLVSNNFSCYQY